MKIIEERISILELKKMAREMFGDMVKAVVDVEKNVMALGGELHSDEESLLIGRGSKQQDLWGINIYPEVKGDGWVEFDSLINLRPAQGNRTRGVGDPKVRKKINEIINDLVER